MLFQAKRRNNLSSQRSTWINFVLICTTIALFLTTIWTLATTFQFPTPPHASSAGQLFVSVVQKENLTSSFSRERIHQIPSRYAVAYTEGKTTFPFHVAVPSQDRDLMRWLLFEDGEYYESRLTAFVEKILKEEPHDFPVIDVGANVGWVSLLAASHGKRAFAFEADRRTLDFLKHSVQLNGFDDLVTVVPNAVSDEDGQDLVFEEHAWNPGQSGIVSDARQVGVDFTGYVVKSVTLDSQLEKRQVYLLLKIDVEGAEEKILRGAKDVLQKGLVKYLHIEWVDPSVEMLISMLDWGYEPIQGELIDEQFFLDVVEPLCRSEDEGSRQQCAEAIQKRFSWREDSGSRADFNIIFKNTRFS